MEHRISGPGPLLGGDGRLREPGWSDSLLLDYDRNAIRSPAWRIKEWDYYCVLSGDFGLALTVADNGYMGLVSATVFDFSVPRETSDSLMTAFPMGRWGLPPSSAAGRTEVAVGGARMSFVSKGGSRRLAFSWPAFGSKAAGDAAGLAGEILLREAPGGSSMVIATPFRRPRRGFYYNQKINCQAASGAFRLGKRDFELEPGSSFAVLDWGRGVWPWSNAWLWGSASGLARRHAKGYALRSDDSRDATDQSMALRSDDSRDATDQSMALRSDDSRDATDQGGAEKPFGFNIGYGFGDTSAASENMVFFDGKAHKIGPLSIERDESDYMKPWRAASEDGRFDMRLEPILDRASKTDLGLLASIQHQVFGSWTGYAILDDGARVEVGGLRGFCEWVVNRW
jgi:hypothetical protein